MKYENRVLRVLEQELRSYCMRAAASVTRETAFEVRITLTLQQPTETTRTDQEKLAVQILRQTFPRVRLLPVDRPIDPAAAGSCCHVAFDPPFGGRPAPRQRGAQSLPAVLDLTFQHGQLTFPFRLVEMEDWVPFGRNVPAAGGRQPLRLPDAADAFPNGALVDVRFWNKRCDLRRTPEREDYVVHVNGRRLRPGDECRDVPRTGTVLFRPPQGAVATLGYSLALERRHG